MAKPEQIQSGRVLAGKVRMLLYSEPGVGKTAFIGSTPKPTLIVKADPTIDAAYMFGNKPDVWSVKFWTDMYDVRDYIISEGHKDYDWIWLDGITLWQELGLDDIMRELVIEKPNRKEDLRDKGEYGVNMTRLNMWIRDVTQAPVNIGFTAHRTIDQIVDVEGTMVERYGPLIQGRNMSPKIQGWMNIVGMLDVKPTTSGGHVRVLYTSPEEGNCAGKEGFMGALPPTMVRPTIPKIVEAIAARRARAGAPGQTTAVPVKAAATKAVAPVKKAAPATKPVAKKG